MGIITLQKSLASNNMKKTILVLLFVCLLQSMLSAQDRRECGTDEIWKQLLKDDPSVLLESQKLEDFTKQFTANYQQKAGAVKIIPVVVHIIHNYGAENIKDQQVFDAIKVLNDDLRKLSSDTNEIVAAFKGIAADCEVEFRLAQKDPFGNCTNGITRTASIQTYSAADPAVKNLVRWPNNMYLNVWLAQNLANGAGGYAYYPGASSDLDGIVVRTSQFGITKRTLTHEVGHYLNLPHTWGYGEVGDLANCTSDDFVGDTPNTIGNETCDLSVISCGSLDNVQNYMEYAFCGRMFTEGQNTRMQAALNSSLSGRNNLWTASNLAATGTDGTDWLCTVDFSTEIQVICEGSAIVFTDRSYNGQTAWSWYFEGATPSYSNAENPVVTYNTAGEYLVSLSIAQGSNIITGTKQSFIKVLPTPGEAMPFSESFEDFDIVNTDWHIVNRDGGNSWELVDFLGFTGAKSFKMNNFSDNEAGRIDELISASIDLTDMQTVDISFQVAFARKIDTTNDILRVYISDDCGLNWAPRWVSSGDDLSTVPAQPASEFFPASGNDWTQHVVSGIDGSYLSNQFRMKFEYVYAGGNNLFIDDINISGVSNTVPMLVSPTHTLASVSLNPTLDWNAVSNVDLYEYQIDSIASFSSPALVVGSLNYISNSSSGTDTEINISALESSTRYYWRARTSTSGVFSAWSAVWNFTTTNQTGLEEQQQIDNVLIFPNPSSGASRITFRTLNTGKVQVTLNDLLGKHIVSVFAGTLINGSHEFSIPVLATGVYILKLETENRTLVQRFVKL